MMNAISTMACKPQVAPKFGRQMNETEDKVELDKLRQANPNLDPGLCFIYRPEFGRKWGFLWKDKSVGGINWGKLTDAFHTDLNQTKTLLKLTTDDIRKVLDEKKPQYGVHNKDVYIVVKDELAQELNQPEPPVEGPGKKSFVQEYVGQYFKFIMEMNIPWFRKPDITVERHASPDPNTGVFRIHFEEPTDGYAAKEKQTVKEALDKMGLSGQFRP